MLIVGNGSQQSKSPGEFGVGRASTPQGDFGVSRESRQSALQGDFGVSRESTPQGDFGVSRESTPQGDFGVSRESRQSISPVKLSAGMESQQSTLPGVCYSEQNTVGLSVSRSQPSSPIGEVSSPWKPQRGWMSMVVTVKLQVRTPHL